MTCAGFRVYRNASRQLTLDFEGDLDENTALCCERETRADLALVASGSLHVLWDLHAVTSYSLDARTVLARLQQFLAVKSQRTAYVADDSVTRSLALWAARMGEQALACIAADRAAAEAWLGASTATQPPRGPVQLAAISSGVSKLALP